jgi:hypothetical protein
MGISREVPQADARAAAPLKGGDQGLACLAVDGCHEVRSPAVVGFAPGCARSPSLTCAGPD